MSQATNIEEIQISDIVKNEVFIKAVKTKLHEVIVKRNNKPALQANERYKRDWYDRLSDKGEVTAEFFIKHIPDIWNKKSDLNSEARQIILYVCNQAVREAYNLD